MAIGKTKRLRGSGRRRVWDRFLSARRRRASFYPAPLRLTLLARRAGTYRPTAKLAARAVLTAVVVGHLFLAALFPQGRNGLFGIEGGVLTDYLSLFPVGDALGFYKTGGKDGFVVYKIFTQDGRVVEGAFPDQEISPRLRYDRWALFTHYVSRDNPQFHDAFLRYLVERLPAAPIKVELLSAKWDWGRNNGASTIDPEKHGGLLVLQKLGTYDGLRKEWHPASAESSK